MTRRRAKSLAGQLAGPASLRRKGRRANLRRRMAVLRKEERQPPPKQLQQKKPQQRLRRQKRQHPRKLQQRVPLRPPQRRVVKPPPLRTPQRRPRQKHLPKLLLSLLRRLPQLRPPLPRLKQPHQQKVKPRQLRKLLRKTDKDRLPPPEEEEEEVGVGVRGGEVEGGRRCVCVSCTHYLWIFASSLHVLPVLSNFANDGSPEMSEHRQHQRQPNHQDVLNTITNPPKTRQYKRETIYPITPSTKNTKIMKLNRRECNPERLELCNSMQLPSRFDQQEKRASRTDCEHLHKCFIIPIINLYHT